MKRIYIIEFINDPTWFDLTQMNYEIKASFCDRRRGWRRLIRKLTKLRKKYPKKTFWALCRNTYFSSVENVRGEMKKQVYFGRL